MDVHPTYEGVVTIHKYRNTCCSKKLSCKFKLAHFVVLKIVLQIEAIVQVNYMKSCVYPINISQLILLRFTQRGSTLAQRGGGAHLCDDCRWRRGGEVLAPCRCSLFLGVRTEVGIRPHGGGDVARRGEVGELPH
jgi:hypothetical protein